MSKHADFLVEIHTEELPPKALLRLAKSFLFEMETRLRKSELQFGETQFFATPRRLAVLVKNLVEKQDDAETERKGPALAAAFDSSGNPTPACVGFARSCNVDPKKLITIKNAAGEWVGFRQKVKGKKVQELLPEMVQQSLAALPIPKRMRWGDNTVEFVRPVHSVILLYGMNVIKATILGCKAGRKTRGHRFHSKKWIDIKKPSDYAETLEKNYVIADFETRKNKIRALATKKNAEVNIREELLEEVTGLVEWPVAFSGNFDKKFLNVPQEALISAMEDHQRYFPVIDKNGKLQSEFVAISNIESKNPKQVITGNERVLRARLSDAAFFFDVDKKLTLESRLENLKHVIFQNKLGTVFEKAERISALAAFIANEIGLNQKLAKRAGLLAKTDLTSELVGEFPELQGIAGYYFAVNDDEDPAVANALREQYRPRFSGDTIPASDMGCVVALSDRIDTLVGVFGINQQPTSEKDPFALRRASLGVLRILIEKKWDLDLRELLQFAVKNYVVKFENPNVVDDVLNFMLERLKNNYQEQGVSSDIFASVHALNISKPYDIHRRIFAVQTFKKLPEADSLSIANKRVNNILSQYKENISLLFVNEQLFENDYEKTLALKLKNQQKNVNVLLEARKYQESLAELAKLREPVDNFFDHVMVMTEEKAVRENRLLLLKQLRELFLQVADIALLQ